MSKDAKKHRKCWTNFKGLWIPYEIMILQELSPTETVVLSLVHSYDNSAKPDGVPCYLDNLDLTEMLSVSKRTVINAVNRLKELGFIEVYTDQSIGNKRFLYSQMVIDPKGRGKRGGSAKIAPPPKAKIAPADGQKLHTPGARSAPAYNKEVNTGVNTKRDTGDSPSPEDIFSPNSKEGKALAAYRLAVTECRALSEEFDEFFYHEIFKRFNKWLLNSTDLEDWYDHVWLKYEPDDIRDEIRKHRASLDVKVWKPDLKHVRTQLKQKQARAEKQPVPKSKDTESADGIWDWELKLAAEDPAGFLARYENEGFFRSMCQRRPVLMDAHKKATEAVA